MVGNRQAHAPPPTRRVKHAREAGAPFLMASMLAISPATSLAAARARFTNVRITWHRMCTFGDEIGATIIA
jgi:hypothetical protein